ncbi:MAG: efflux RND transporter periplasmic adaptor subunit [Verrucomicrobiota bacterium]
MKKRYWISLLLIAGIGAAVSFKFGKREKPTEVTVETAVRGDITRVVTATGRVYPEAEVTISSEVAGEIIELGVKDGQIVTSGDLLVRVNPDRLEAQVLQQEAALRAAQASSSEAKARMLQAELDLKRQDNLFEKGHSTQEQLYNAQTLLEINEASHQATLSRIEQQEMQLKEARDSLAKATTFSPISGTITSLSSELGDRVVGTGQFAGTEIMRVADLSQMEIRVDVSEADIVHVKIGDKANIEIEALPDQVFEGEVSEIANSAQGGGNHSTDQLTTFQVKIRLIDSNSRIRPGMTATADVETKTVIEVVKVPLQAITVRAKEEVEKQLSGEADEEESGSKKWGEKKEEAPRNRDELERVAFVFEDGKVSLVRVKTGIADTRFIEVPAGIEVGQKVVVGGYRILSRELEHGDAVLVAGKKSGKSDK